MTLTFGALTREAWLLLNVISSPSHTRVEDAAYIAPPIQASFPTKVILLVHETVGEDLEQIAPPWE